MTGQGSGGVLWGGGKPAGKIPIKIKLNKNKRQHLLLTGKNGAGKTSAISGINEIL